MSKSSWGVLVIFFFALVTTVTPIAESWRALVVWFAWLLLLMSCFGWMLAHYPRLRFSRRPMVIVVIGLVGAALSIGIWLLVQPTPVSTGEVGPTPPRAVFQLFDGREVVMVVGNLGGTEAIFRATGRIVSTTKNHVARDPYRVGWKDGLLEKKEIQPSEAGRLLLATASFSRGAATISICGDGSHVFATYSVRAADQFAARIRLLIVTNPPAEFTPKDFLLELRPDFKEKILRVTIIEHSVGSYGPPVNAIPNSGGVE